MSAGWKCRWVCVLSAPLSESSRFCCVVCACTGEPATGERGGAALCGGERGCGEGVGRVWRGCGKLVEGVWRGCAEGVERV